MTTSIPSTLILVVTIVAKRIIAIIVTVIAIILIPVTALFVHWEACVPSPPSSESPILQKIPEILLALLIYCKVYCLVKLYWAPWVRICSKYQGFCPSASRPWRFWKAQVISDYWGLSIIPI